MALKWKLEQSFTNLGGRVHGMYVVWLYAMSQFVPPELEVEHPE